VRTERADRYDFSNVVANDENHRQPPHDEQTPRTVRYARDEGYVSGVMPAAWLRTALSGTLSSARLGVAMWYLALRHNTFEVRIKQDAREYFALSAMDVSRGLDKLEQLGLITVLDRGRGSLPKVLIHPHAGSSLNA
jgi:hypothetical protein